MRADPAQEEGASLFAIARGCRFCSMEPMQIATTGVRTGLAMTLN